jgi:hypothetical protein
MCGENKANNDERHGLLKVAKPGRTFRGVLIPTGPSGEAKTVMMYVALASRMEAYGDKDVLTADCVTLGELREQIDNLKDDLEWVYKGMERIMKKEQRKK